MPAVPLQLSKSTFLINKTDAMILRGRHLGEVVRVDFSSTASTNITWVMSEFDDPMNGQYMLVSGMPRFIQKPDPLPDPGTTLIGDVIVTLTSRCGGQRSLRIPAFYLTP